MCNENMFNRHDRAIMYNLLLMQCFVLSILISSYENSPTIFLNPSDQLRTLSVVADKADYLYVSSLWYMPPLIFQVFHQTEIVRRHLNQQMPCELSIQHDEYLIIITTRNPCISFDHRNSQWWLLTVMKPICLTVLSWST